MERKLKIKIGEEFKPSLQLKKLYYIYWVLGILFGVLPCYIGLLLFAQFEMPIATSTQFKTTIAISILTFAILVFTTYWISRYYDTIVYKLTESEIMWRRGVWFKKTGIVPYAKITNIDILQGPISRMLGIAVLKIQTAGYSGQQAGPEIRIEGVEQFEELRELIMEFVRRKKPLAAETYEEGNIDLRILEELVKIRNLLEKFSEK